MASGGAAICHGFAAVPGLPIDITDLVFDEEAGNEYQY
jgi:hypothetical protein